MERILNILKNLPEERINDQIEDIFINLVEELEIYLKSYSLFPNIRVVFHENEKRLSKENDEILDLGVLRNWNQDIFTIDIFDDYRELLPIILLREAYYCFIPESIKEFESIKLLINYIIENNLKDLAIIQQWKSLIRPYIINHEEDSLQFDKIEKFLSLEGTEDENPIIFSINFIRRNFSSFQDNKIDLYDLIFKEFVFKTSKSLRNDELIETIRVLIEIFYKVKKYSDLLEYKKLFLEFKKKRIIQTKLSLRKFIKNMSWINKCSYIAPSYQVNWKEMDICNMACTIYFNPVIDKEKIDKFIQNLPFFLWSKSSENNFEIEVFGWFNLPSCYLNDLINFLENLKSLNYIIDVKAILYESFNNFLNLNYFKSFYNKGTLINIDHPDYNSKYEILFNLEYSENFQKKKFSPLDFLILDRLRYWSVSGFKFVRRADTIKILKLDLINEILKQEAIIKELKKVFKEIYMDNELKKKIYNIMDRYEDSGFFYIEYLLNTINDIIDLLVHYLIKNKSIKTYKELENVINNRIFSKKIEENLLINDEEAKKIILRKLLPYFFTDREQYENKIKFYKILKTILNLFRKLHVFNLSLIEKIILNKKFLNKIIREKEDEIKKIYSEFNLNQITTKTIDNIINSFITNNPPLIKPILISTISTTNFANYYIQLYIKYNKRTYSLINRIKKIFPRVIFSIGRDLFSNKEIINLQIYLPNLIKEEKEKLIFALKNLFKEELIKIQRYLNDGIYNVFSWKSFYNFYEKEFVYYEDIFREFLKFTKKIFNVNLKKIERSNNNFLNIFWENNVNLEYLTKNQSFINENKNHFILNFQEFEDLTNFNKDLKHQLININKIQDIQNRDFFKKFISKIKFFPKFQAFSLSQYYLYIRPVNFDIIDFKLLLLNTFQNVQFIVASSNNFLLIKYLFPYRNPNQSYLKWLIYSKKAISEFHLFLVKKIYHFFHFKYNISSKGWNLDFNYFKSYMQKILFDPNFNPPEIEFKQYNLDDLNPNEYKIDHPNNEIFNNLMKIYNTDSKDIINLLIEQNDDYINKVIFLIKEDLIFPYLKIKNLRIKEIVYIIVPDIKQIKISLFKKIFSYFNLGFIYEIEGNYYIHSFRKIEENKDGIVIKLYLPECDLSELKRVIKLLFKYLKIRKYLIIHDLIKADNLLRSIFGNLKEINYNPLKNLKWNENDKKWINHKLFNEKFKPIYPRILTKKEK
ncbi:MAG: hypothetical protein ACTSXH_05260 [Promethearchaeota archaeon]